jgi:hypothetical protein
MFRLFGARPSYAGARKQPCQARTFPKFWKKFGRKLGKKIEGIHTINNLHWRELVPKRKLRLRTVFGLVLEQAFGENC